jgi:hypothetical protein
MASYSPLMRDLYWLVTSYRLSALSCQLSAISAQLSVASYRLSAVSSELSAGKKREDWTAEKPESSEIVKERGGPGAPAGGDRCLAYTSPSSSMTDWEG